MYRAKIVIHGVCYYGMWTSLDQATHAVQNAQQAGVYALVEEQ